MTYANLVSTGSYLPEIEITNDALREKFNALAPEFIDKMEASTGIRSRWYAPADWAASDLALRAARQALERAGKSPADVDLIILGTDSPDYITPATSVVLQAKLGAKNAGTFDVACACASFPTAIAKFAPVIPISADRKWGRSISRASRVSSLMIVVRGRACLASNRSETSARVLCTTGATMCEGGSFAS